MNWLNGASSLADRMSTLAFRRWPSTRRLVTRLAGGEARAGRARWLLVQRVREGFYNVGYRFAGAADGYPLPPARLVYDVIANWQLGWYQLGGMFMHQAMTATLWRNQINPASLRTVLDFGCGCGRILRHWPAGQHELWGSDYNPTLIAWCTRRLHRLGRFTVNGATPPLSFATGMFDFVYRLLGLHAHRARSTTAVDLRTGARVEAGRAAPHHGARPCERHPARSFGRPARGRRNSCDGRGTVRRQHVRGFSRQPVRAQPARGWSRSGRVPLPAARPTRRGWTSISSESPSQAKGALRKYKTNTRSTRTQRTRRKKPEKTGPVVERLILERALSIKRQAERHAAQAQMLEADVQSTIAARDKSLSRREWCNRSPRGPGCPLWDRP